MVMFLLANSYLFDIFKREMGLRLHFLKKRLGKGELSHGKSIKGKGRLADKFINSLQIYYGNLLIASGTNHYGHVDLLPAVVEDEIKSMLMLLVKSWFHVCMVVP